MDSPQLENGYTRIADEIMEALIRYRIPGEQMQCLLLIIRKTYGYNKIWDTISNSQFVEYTGLKKPNVCRAVKSLIEKNVVIKKDNTYIPTYCFNKNYKKWKALSKKITVIKSDILVLSKKIPTIDSITIDNKANFKFEKKVPVPKNICLTKEMKGYVAKKGCENSGHAEDLFEGFCIYHRKKGNKFNDWYAAFQTWVRTDKKYNPDKYLATRPYKWDKKGE